MNEFELIERYFNRAPRNADVRIGIGDDGAVIAPTAGMEYVLSDCLPSCPSSSLYESMFHCEQYECEATLGAR